VMTRAADADMGPSTMLTLAEAARFALRFAALRIR